MDVLNQAKNLIKKYQNISICLPETQNVSLTEGDVFCSGSALFYILKKINKNVNLSLKRIPNGFEFLTGSRFVISVDTKKSDVAEVFYEKNSENLKIWLTATGTELSSKTISFSSQNFPPETENFNPELLITLGAQGFEGLGKAFFEKPELFYQTPLINIDNNPSNQNFGEVNLIDIKSCSCSEIIIDLIRTL